MSVTKDENTGKWMIRCRYKDPVTSEWKEHKRRGISTRNEAKLLEAKFLEDVEIQASGMIKFNDLIDNYLEQHEKLVKESTYITDKSKIESNIRPFFDGYTLNSIDVNIIRGWKQYMNDKNYSLRYRKNMFTILNNLFNHAKKYLNYNDNPCEREGTFKETSKDYINNEMDFWTKEEFDQFIKVVDDPTYKALFSLLYWTGIRLGEALALNWNDFTDNFRKMRINKSCTNKTAGAVYTITKPKTKQSNRIILVPDSAIEDMKKLYDYSLDYVGFERDWFIFGTVRPLPTTSIERTKNKYCKIANVKQIRIHDFRHSHASYLINNSPNDKNLIIAISKRLGHSSPTVTLEVYAHMFPNDDEKVLDILNKQ